MCHTIINTNSYLWNYFTCLTYFEPRNLVVHTINSGGFVSSSFGHIIRDIKLSSSSFHNLSFCYTRRQGNRIAHKLARFGISFYIKIFFLYVDFILDESNTGSRISILTGNGFHQNVKSLICIINNTLYYILLVVLELGPYVWHEQ